MCSQSRLFKGWTRALVIPVVKGLVYSGPESDLPLRPVRKNPAALAPLLPHALWRVCHSGYGRDFRNACTRWSQLLCLGGCLPGVRERNPLPTPPRSSEASTEHRPGREEQGGDRNVASKPGLLTGGQSVSSGFQLGCSQVEKQLKPEVDASLHLCAT